MFRSRMLSQSFKGILELAIDKVGVNLGRGNIPVPQRPLYDKQVTGGPVKVGCKRMPQAMRSQVLFNPGLPQPQGYSVGYLPLAKTCSSIGQKQCAACCCALPGSFFQISFQQDAEVGFYEFDLHHIPFGSDSQMLCIEVDIVCVQRLKLTDADTGAKQDFDHDPVPHSGKARAAFYLFEQCLLF